MPEEAPAILTRLGPLRQCDFYGKHTGALRSRHPCEIRTSSYRRVRITIQIHCVATNERQQIAIAWRHIDARQITENQSSVTTAVNTSSGKRCVRIILDQNSLTVAAANY